MNVDEIKRLAEQFGFRCEVYTKSIYLYTKYDEFYFRISDLHSRRKFPLFHKNKDGDENKYHIHREYWDVPYMLNSISEHDEYNNPSHIRKSKMDILYEKIKEQRLNKKKCKKSKYIS